MKTKLWLALYALLMALAVPLALLRILWRARREPLYRAHWRERLALALPRPKRGGDWIWLHAVSLGETRAAAPLIAALRAALPGLHIWLTHTTATGREAGRALLQPGDAQSWLPWDAPFFARRFLRHLLCLPSRRSGLVGVILETEIWPGYSQVAHGLGVPLFLVNARLSAKSAAGYARIAPLARAAFGALTSVLAQSEEDAERLRALGARTAVYGNLKFDVAADAALLQKGHALRPRSRRILLAASTREGEEAQLLQLWRLAQQRGAALPILLIVPRHPQRFDAVASLLTSGGWRWQRRSAWGQEIAPEQMQSLADCWLGDSLGEMPLYYALADLALLGGSFGGTGGQNLIEAAACSCPLLMGPSLFNFAQAAQLAEQAGCARSFDSMPAALAEATRLLQTAPDELVTMRAQTQTLLQPHRGAAGRMAEVIVESISPIGDGVGEVAMQMLIERAKSGEHSPNAIAVGKVAAWEVEAARAFGLDINGFTHTVSGDAVRHTTNRHSNIETEKSRHQMFIKESDLLLIPDVVNDPDSILLGSKTRNGLDAVISRKVLPDGTLVSVQEARTGRRALHFVTMWKEPGAPNAHEIVPRVGLYVPSDTRASTALSITENPRRRQEKTTTPPQ